VDRGFNQSALVAGALARGVGIPWAPRLLSKVVETPSQASLGRDERRTNLRSAFLANHRLARPGTRFILIDDVVTTGETARACALALSASQMHVVEVWTLSRASRESLP
jgi:predicted amidophosphoribosyltransferase